MIVHMFWQGELSLYEKACMASFVQQGFELRVHSYSPLPDLPAGVKACDARAVLPEELSTAYTQAGQKGSLASFSNRFRYQLLRNQGGLWVDADMFCLRSLADYQALFQARANQVVVAREDPRSVNGAMMMAPPEHTFVQRLLKAVEAKGFEIEKWGMIGPRLITEHTEQHAQECHILDSQSFYPIHYSQFYYFLLPGYHSECLQSCDSSYGLHLWNEKFRQFMLPKNMLPPRGSFLYDKLVAVLGENIAPCMSKELVRYLLEAHEAIKLKKNIKLILAQKFTQLLNELKF